ncbi:YdeI/OmpD-associated family protein [Brachybacterium sp. J153]|uniref:YdeI/OmpD-associated family protein n=1 Tax=Brachybacterium sp. J153 TaxID=3116488 RepID=UPI002E7A94FE|nr:YdeI/OmpD-associated family protein [Brachybacterium sp. J153]MEE1619383.1 YdeI/OmpD-associated family protein [Brachybacterium sp. J153]
MAAKAPVTVTGRATVRAIGERLILPLPEDLSAKLPSRGQVAVEGTLEEYPLTTVLEPDGRKGHWIDLDTALIDELDLTEGTSLAVTLTTRAEWPEPEVPEDLAAALEEADDLADTWPALTPMARWEWVRWVRATRSEDTRARRVEVSIDKLRHGSRRPCCFDLSSCTDPELARSGKLPE